MDQGQSAAVTPVIDREQIDGLVAVAGRDGARSILDAFWRSTNKLLAQLQEQLAAGDFVEAARTAHALKGSSLNVGALRLSGAARTIEDACRKRDSELAAAQIDAARTDYADTTAAFEAHLAA